MEHNVPKIIGKGMVYDHDQNKDIEVVIKKTKSSDNTHYSLEINTTKNGIDKLGQVSFFVVQGAEIPFGPFSKITSEDEKVSTIRVTWIYSKYKTKYKGVGTLLMQAVIERSWKKAMRNYGQEVDSCKGRITLCASGESHGFYRTLGMCCNQGSQLDHFIDEKVRIAKSQGLSTEFEYTIGNVGMHFPLEAIEKWKDKIKKMPVLVKTSQWLKS